MNAESVPLRYAKVFDGLIDGKPDFESRERLQSVEERTAIARYLRSGGVVARTSRRDDDLLESNRKDAIRRVIQTDGEWIWAEATIYYLEQYGIAPERGLIDHIRAREYKHEELTGEELARVATAYFAGDWQE